MRRYFKSTLPNQLLQQVIDKIERGLNENKKILEWRLIERLQYAHDGKGINIDWAFEGIYVINKVANMIRKIKKENLKKVFFYEDTNIEQFLIDIENLRHLEFNKIKDSTSLFSKIDEILESQHSTIKMYKDRRESKEKEYKKSKANYENLRPWEHKIKRASDLNDELLQLQKGRRYWGEITPAEESLITEIEKTLELNSGPIFHKYHKDRDVVEREINRKKEMLQDARFQVKKLNDELKRAKDEFKKVNKIVHLKKHCMHYIKTINDERNSQYDDLRTVLLASNQDVLYLERYFKFRKYKSFNIKQLDSKTFGYLIKLRNNLDSINLV